MDWVSSLLLATVRLAIPVLLISLAELYGQRAGMVNIGLEGLAAIGALVGFTCATSRAPTGWAFCAARLPVSRST